MRTVDGTDVIEIILILTIILNLTPVDVGTMAVVIRNVGIITTYLRYTQGTITSDASILEA